MEFRKNRQKVILEALDEVKKISVNNISCPAIFLDAQPIKMIAKAQESRIRDLDEKVKHFEMLKNYEWLIRLLLVIIPSILIWLLSK